MGARHGRELRLGDVITKLASALHIPQCEKCEQRQRILNEIQKVGVKETIRRLREVGFSYSSGTSEKPPSLQALIKEMEDCCDK